MSSVRGVSVLAPKTITDAMIAAGTTVAEPAAGETAWVSGGTYVLGDLRIRSTTHRVYECIQPHAGRTALPEDDTLYWFDRETPTQRFAPFDVYTSTAAMSTGSMTYVLTPGYFNSLSMYGMVGTDVSVSIKDAPGGATISSHAQSLLDPPSGWYGYLFLPRRVINKLVLKDLPIRPTAELTVTVSAATGEPVGIGMLNVGDLRPLISGDAQWGGTQYGASAEPVSYSYIKTNDDGTTSIKRRHKATNMRVSAVMPRAVADGAVQAMQEVLDVPVSVIGVDAAGYDSLNTFGLAKGRLTYRDVATAIFDIDVKGFI